MVYMSLTEIHHRHLIQKVITTDITELPTDVYKEFVGALITSQTCPLQSPPPEGCLTWVGSGLTRKY